MFNGICSGPVADTLSPTALKCAKVTRYAIRSEKENTYEITVNYFYAYIDYDNWSGNGASNGGTARLS